MGEVYRGRDVRLKRDVAIKVLPAAFASDPGRIARFEREARAASALNHPNIVPVFDVGQDNGIPYIVSELVPGETLAAMMDRGPLRTRQVIDMGAQIASGLAAAHSAGIVHRDLKPANVIVAPDGRVRILDFGLASQERAAAADDTTIEISSPGQVVGTPGYMSPEQVRGTAVDSRSDLFNLGIILYEMAAGKRAFGGDSSVERMNAVLTKDPPDPPATMPPALDRIIRRCLEKDPTRRFQSAADLQFALESVSAATPVPPARARRRLWPAVAALCLAAIPVTVWYGRTGSEPKSPPQTKLRALTSDTGLTTDAAVSRDGKFVAYASDRSDPSNLDIWVQQIQSGSAVRITNDPADDYDPSISPDGSTVAFRSERNGGGIYVAPTLGGDARLLIPQGRRPRFSPDGQRLLYRIGLIEDFADGQYFVQRLAGGQPTQIGAGCHGIHPATATWSPEGDRILFRDVCDSEDAVYIFDTNGRRTGKFKLDAFAIDQWLPHPSRLIVPFSGSAERFAGVTDSEGSAITAVRLSNDDSKTVGAPGRIVFGTGGERHASASADGRYMALSVVSAQEHVWGITVDAGGHPHGDPRRLRPGGSGESYQCLTSDGRFLVFLTRQGGRADLHIRDLQKGSENEIPWNGFEGSDPILDRGGKKLAYVTMSGRNRSVFELPVGGGFPTEIMAERNAGLDAWGVWDYAADGSALLIFSGPRIRILDLGTRTAAPFLDDPDEEIWQAHLSPDGRWVAFLGVRAVPKSHIYVAPFRKGRIPRSEWILVSQSEGDDKPHFSANGRSVMMSSDRDGYRCIWAQPLGEDMHAAGAAFAVYHAHESRRSLRNISLATFDIGAGGGLVAFPQEDRTGNVWLLEPAAATK